MEYDAKVSEPSVFEFNIDKQLPKMFNEKGAVKELTNE